jgi:hypothetical protein
MPEPDQQNAEKDKETIISIVKEMTESMTGLQSTKHWSKDALWFDIPAFASNTSSITSRLPRCLTTT